MLIGELSARTGVSQRMLRYYEEQGLLTASRDTKGYRRYTEDSVTTVRHIRKLLDLGLSTEVIAQMLPCAIEYLGRLDLCPTLVRTLRAELAEMDERIDTLRRNRGALAGYLPVV